MNKFEHLILKPTGLKGLLPSTIDRLLTNHKRNIPPQGDHLGSKENLCQKQIKNCLLSLL